MYVENYLYLKPKILHQFTDLKGMNISPEAGQIRPTYFLYSSGDTPFLYYNSNIFLKQQVALFASP